MADSPQCFDEIERTLKKAAGALDDARIPFMLGGSLAVWVRGGPESCNDLDLMLKHEDADAALAALEDAGMRPERPPEGWLYKAWDGDVLVDVIFNPRGLEMTDEVFARGDTREGMAISVSLMALEDVFATKLLSFDEHSCDYKSVLLMARTLREQMDWDALRERTEHHPFAAAFFLLCERLDIAPPAGRASEGRTAVRVIDPR